VFFPDKMSGGQINVLQAGSGFAILMVILKEDIMKTSEKISNSRGFVSPSFESDIQQPSSLMSNFDWKSPAALMVGGWVFKKFPKATVVGLLAAGAYLGYTMLNKKENKSYSDLH
jgi:uncharacterized membrane protein YebE (DUF533 family)